MLSYDAASAPAPECGEIYCDIARHHGGGQHLMAAILPMPRDIHAALVVHRAREARPFDEADRAVLSTLGQHAHNALRLRLRIDEHGQDASIRAAMLDHLGQGIVLAGPDGCAVYVNRVAQGWMGAGLRLGPRGQVQAHDAEATQRLARLIRAACAGKHGGSMLAGGGEARLALHVGALPMVAPARLPPPGAGPGGLALIAVRALRPSPKVDARQLADLFGLTRAEVAVLPLLLSGQSAEAVARLRGVSLATVRSQTRAILAKTEAVNLRALASLVGGLS